MEVSEFTFGDDLYQHRGCPNGAGNSKQQNTIRGGLEALAEYRADPTFGGLEVDVRWDASRGRWSVTHDDPLVAERK